MGAWPGIVQIVFTLRLASLLKTLPLALACLHASVVLAQPGAGDPDVALFAAWMRKEDRRERDARRQAKETRRLEESARALTSTKDAAAAEVKRLRASTSATPEQRAAAEAAYCEALAAVVAAETGEALTLAPTA